jgi:hypothetical protein
MEMTMFNFVYSLSSVPLFIVLFLIGSVISALSLFFVYRFLPITLRKRENVPAGYIAGSITVIYAVLAGFVILYAMNTFDKAADISIHEAITITKIFRDASRLPEPQRSQIQSAMRNYANIVINVEFPAIAKDKMTKAGLAVLDNLDHQLNTYDPNNIIIFHRMHSIHAEIDDLYATYDQRMNINNSALTPDLWALFIISSVLTLVINSMLGVALRLHIVLQIILTLMVSSTLFLIIAMDHPFSGSFAISSHVFEKSLQEMDKYSSKKQYPQQ